MIHRPADQQADNVSASSTAFDAGCCLYCIIACLLSPPSVLLPLRQPCLPGAAGAQPLAWSRGRIDLCVNIFKLFVDAGGQLSQRMREVMRCCALSEHMPVLYRQLE